MVQMGLFKKTLIMNPNRILQSVLNDIDLLIAFGTNPYNMVSPLLVKHNIRNTNKTEFLTGLIKLSIFR
jgi:hypothetical protein